MDGCETVVVVGACGGVGASTVAALLARRRAYLGRRALLLDLADDGAGLEVLLGLEGSGGLRWHGLRDVRGVVDPVELSAALPRWQGVEVLAGAGGPEVVPSLWPALRDGADAARGVPGRSLSLVVDAGAGSVPAPAGAVAVLVTGQDVRGVACGLRRLSTGPAVTPTRWAGVVVRARRRARLAPSDVAHAVGLPLLGVVPESGSLAEATERGLGPLPAPWSRVARAIATVDSRIGRGWDVARPGVGGAREAYVPGVLPRGR